MRYLGAGPLALESMGVTVAGKIHERFEQSVTPLGLRLDA